MGVPVVSLVGQTAVGRGGWSILSNVGLPELAARSAEEYVRIASELAHDLSRLSRLRKTLRQRMEQSPLMNAPRFARHIEAAFRQMWRQWCATARLPPGAPAWANPPPARRPARPRSIDIPPAAAGGTGAWHPMIFSALGFRARFCSTTTRRPHSLGCLRSSRQADACQMSAEAALLMISREVGVGQPTRWAD